MSRDLFNCKIPMTREFKNSQSTALCAAEHNEYTRCVVKQYILGNEHVHFLHAQNLLFMMIVLASLGRRWGLEVVVDMAKLFLIGW
jgi:hypothetical protein